MRKLSGILIIIALLTIIGCGGSGDNGTIPVDPSPETVSQNVGIDGGTLRAEDGSWELIIPKGALNDEVTISVTAGSMAPGTAPLQYSQVGQTVRFEPHGLVFNEKFPAIFKYKYPQNSMNEAGVLENMISFYYINDDNTVESAPTALNPADNMVTVQLAHFSFGGALTFSIALVNAGIITSPFLVQFIADRIIDQFNNEPNDDARRQLYEDNINILWPFMDKCQEVLGNNPMEDSFPAVDFDPPGSIGNTPLAILLGEPDLYTNTDFTNITVGGSNVVTYQYSINGGLWSAEYDISEPIQEWDLLEGPNTIEVRGRNDEGEWQDAATTWSWTIDFTEPLASEVTLSDVPASETDNTAATISVGGGEFLRYRYRLDGSDWTDRTGISTPIELTDLTNGSHTLEVIVMDAAGNWQLATGPKVHTWEVDLTAPEGSMVINDDDANTTTLAVTLTNSVTDAVDMRFSNDLVTWSDWETYSDTKAWELETGADGERTVYGQYRDSFGRVSQYSDTIVYTEYPFDTAETPGEVVPITVGSETVNMIYANNSDSITFPTGCNDDGTATLTEKFFMGETEVTNALMAEVLQWAKGAGKFGETNSSVSNTTVQYHNQQLLELDNNYCKINYSSETFSVVSGYEDHPVVNVTWYGAIMFCNWLTEMRDGSDINKVYGNIDDTWIDDETTEDTSKSGYRLPSRDEWGFAARYIDGTDWTYGDHVSGDESGACYNDGSILGGLGMSSVFSNYAWHKGNSDTGSGIELQPVKQKTENHLGLYDMTGNVREWCFTTESGSTRVLRGGCWGSSLFLLRIGFYNNSWPSNESRSHGFRFARTQ